MKKKIFIAFLGTIFCSNSLFAWFPSAGQFYFIPVSEWQADNATFKFHAYGCGYDTWVNMTLVPNTTNVYECTISSAMTSSCPDATSFEIYRSAPCWGTNWNNLYDGGAMNWGTNNCYTMTNYINGAPMNGNGTMSVYCTNPSPPQITNSGASVYNQGQVASSLSMNTSPSATNYQWFVSATNSNIGGVAVTGLLTSAGTYTPLTTTEGTKYYYLVASNGSGVCTTPSNTIAISIIPSSCSNIPSCSTTQPYRVCAIDNIDKTCGVSGWGDEISDGWGGACSNNSVGAPSNSDWVKYTVTMPCSGKYTATIRYKAGANTKETSIRRTSSDTYAQSQITFATADNNWTPTSLAGSGSIETAPDGTVTFYLFPGENVRINYIDFTWQAPCTTAPTANAGGTQTVAINPATNNASVTLNATAPATDNVGVWSVTNSPSGSTYSFSSITANNATFTADKIGSYTLQWEVMTPGGCTACNTKTITITCATPDNKTVQAETSPICANTGTNIQVLSSQSGVIYSLFNAANIKIGSDITGNGNTINFPTGNLTETTTFVVQTSTTNTIYCTEVQIGSNVTVEVSPVSVAGTASTESETIYEDNTATITLEGYTGAIQWQISDNGTDGWTNVTYGDGATTDTYTTIPLSVGDYYFMAVVTNNPCSAATSNVVHIQVIAPPPFVTLTVAPLLVKVRDIITLSAETSGFVNPDLTYSVKYEDDEVWTPIFPEESPALFAPESENTITYKPEAAGTYYFKVEAIESSDNNIYAESDEVSVLVVEPITVYARRPTTWNNDLTIFYWTTDADGVWGDMELVGSNDPQLGGTDCGWYKYEIPQGASVIFGNGLGYWVSDDDSRNNSDYTCNVYDIVSDNSKYIIAEIQGGGEEGCGRHVCTDISDVAYSETGLTIYVRMPKSNGADGWDWNGEGESEQLYIKYTPAICDDGEYTKMDPVTFKCVNDASAGDDIWFSYTIKQDTASFVISPFADGGSGAWDTTYTSSWNGNPTKEVFSILENYGEGLPRILTDATLPDGCTPTGIDTPQPLIKDVVVYSNNRQIFVVGADNFKVYNITGREVANSNLPLGIYIVKIGNKAYKAVVR